MPCYRLGIWLILELNFESVSLPAFTSNFSFKFGQTLASSLQNNSDGTSCTTESLQAHDCTAGGV